MIKKLWSFWYRAVKICNFWKIKKSLCLTPLPSSLFIFYHFRSHVFGNISKILSRSEEEASEDAVNSLCENNTVANTNVRIIIIIAS